MNMDVIMQLVSTVAFPICMCILEAWYIKYQLDTHNKEVDEFRKALDSNTIILNKLYERLDGGNKDGN